MGGGFSSLSAASYLGKAGFDVTLLEKNDSVGGRARQWKKNGFVFDMGPTFYWMPDVLDDFFKDFGKKTEDFYQQYIWRFFTLELTQLILFCFLLDWECCFMAWPIFLFTTL